MPILQGKKVLVTGVTGVVGFPVAQSLAESGSEVWAAGRFADEDKRKAIEAAGITTATVDLAEGDYSKLPDDFDYVLNFAVDKATPDFDRALRVNAEGIGLLMAHCRSARAVLHCSSTAVYEDDGHRHFKETDPLGDNHRAAGMLTYSISKIAAEAVVGQAARLWGLPTVIARLNVPYGNTWGKPYRELNWMMTDHEIKIHPDEPVIFNPIHEDDIVAMVPRLLDVAAVPATIVNWGGVDTVSTEEWCAYFEELTGHHPKFVRTLGSVGSVAVDTTKMVELVGPTQVHWRDGFRRMAEARMAADAP